MFPIFSYVLITGVCRSCDSHSARDTYCADHYCGFDTIIPIQRDISIVVVFVQRFPVISTSERSKSTIHNDTTTDWIFKG